MKSIDISVWGCLHVGISLDELLSSYITILIQQEPPSAWKANAHTVQTMSGQMLRSEKPLVAPRLGAGMFTGHEDQLRLLSVHTLGLLIATRVFGEQMNGAIYTFMILLTG